MTLAADLLDQGRRLATLDRGRPKQANLRRSVSATYYSLFHLLGDAGARRISRARPGTPAYDLVARQYQHATMATVSRAVTSGTANWVHSAGLTQPELVRVASAFLLLQEERHRADYDTSATFVRAEALELVELVERAFREWKQVRSSVQAAFYLLALLLGPPRRP